MLPPIENIKFWVGAGLVALILSSSPGRAPRAVDSRAESAGAGGDADRGEAAMNLFAAVALWFLTVTLALVLWMLRIYGA